MKYKSFFLVNNYSRGENMKKRKLRSFVIPSFITMLIISLFFTSAIVNKNKENKNKLSNINFVTNSIINSDLPVLGEVTKVINPYTDPSTTIGKKYYDYSGSKEEQEKSIVYHDNTYLQNSGIDFVNDKVFDVVAVLDGTVVNVKEDELLGKIVEIKHGNDMIGIYQSLSEVSVKKDEKVSQGQIIGKSGTNELDKVIGNHLHFEIYMNGQVVNPSNYLDKELTKTQE